MDLNGGPADGNYDRILRCLKLLSAGGQFGRRDKTKIRNRGKAD